MAVSIVEALNIIDQNIISNIPTEFKDIEDSLGFIAAADIVSKVNLPKFDNSAMDGYAINSKDLGKIIKIQDGTIFAGTKVAPKLLENHALRIMTGAPVPDGADIVIPIENINFINDCIKLPPDFKIGANIRLKGEELKSGSICIKKGEEINSYTITLLASQGIEKIEVFKKPLVAILSSGDELKYYKEKNLSDFEIYDSNMVMLKTRVKSLNCEVKSISGSPDDINLLKMRIANSLNCNLIITTGGASVGDKDFTKETFKELGMKYLFEKVDIKPGKPTSLGIINNTYILILPGNPTAAMINFELFGKFIINKLKNSAMPYHFILKTQISDEFKLKSGKFSVILGYFNGNCFKPLSHQSPNFLSPLKNINSFLITKPQIDKIEKDKKINVVMLNEMSENFEVENIFIF